MKKIVYLVAVIMVGTACSSFGQIPNLKKGLEKVTSTIPVSNSLTEDEVARGLKEALNNGIEKGVSQLSKADGYFKDPQIKIPMPAEAKQVEEKLRKLGQGKKVDDAIESINRAAEDAASASKDLFVSAIKNLTLKDVMNILNGKDDAATTYLSSNTRSALVEKFKPIISNSLDKVGAT